MGVIKSVMFSNVGGIRTRWSSQGSGEPVLLVHGGGLGYSLSVWDAVSDLLAERGWKPIALDLPGYGESSPPTDLETYSAVEFLRSFIDEVCNERVHLVGHSVNGNHIVNLSLSHPENLLSATTVGTGRLLPGYTELKRNVESSSASPSEKKSEPTREDVRVVLTRDVFDPQVVTEDRLESVYEMSVGANFVQSIARSSLRREIAEPLWQKLQNLQVPLLAVFGAMDKNRAGALAPQLVKECPSVRVEVIPDCSHLVQWDKPEVLVELMTDFYESL